MRVAILGPSARRDYTGPEHPAIEFQNDHWIDGADAHPGDLINVFDAILLLQHIVGLITHPPQANLRKFASSCSPYTVSPRLNHRLGKKSLPSTLPISMYLNLRPITIPSEFHRASIELLSSIYRASIELNWFDIHESPLAIMSLICRAYRIKPWRPALT